jgi:hypothetical protein
MITLQMARIWISFFAIQPDTLIEESPIPKATHLRILLPAEAT